MILMAQLFRLVTYDKYCVNLPRSIVLNHTRSLPSITRYRWASTFRERASLTDLKRLFRATTVAHTCIIVKLYSHHIPVIYHMHMHIYLYIYIYISIFTCNSILITKKNNYNFLFFISIIYNLHIHVFIHMCTHRKI